MGKRDQTIVTHPPTIKETAKHAKFIYYALASLLWSYSPNNVQYMNVKHQIHYLLVHKVK